MPGDVYDDRTHLAALDATVYAFASGKPANAQVPKDKVLRRIQFKILTDNGVPVTTAEDVKADIRRANEMLSQIGIYIDVDPKIAIQVVTTPAGVDAHTLSISNDLDILTSEEQALFNALGTASADDIVVFYARQLGNDVYGGEAVAPFFYPSFVQTKSVNNILLGTG